MKKIKGVRSMEWLVLEGKQNGFEQCAALRQAVFVEEQHFQQESDAMDDYCLHLLNRNDGIPAATARAWEKEPGHWIVGRVAVSRSLRGRHLGQQLMNQVISELKQRGAKMVELSAQCQAEGFYQKLGFISTGQQHMDEHCPHVTMIKTLP